MSYKGFDTGWLLVSVLVLTDGAAKIQYQPNQSLCLAWLVVLDSINCLHSGRSSRALYEKKFEGNSLQLALGAS